MPLAEMLDVELVLDHRLKVGESPVWSESEQAIYLIDIHGAELHRVHPESGRHDKWSLPERVGSIALCKNGGLLVALRKGLFHINPETMSFTPLAAVDEPLENRLNDGRCDRQGRFWVGSMAEPPRAGVSAGSLYRYHGGARMEMMVGGLVVSNGLAFSPDGRRLYHSDSHASVSCIWRWDLDPDTGQIFNRTLFADTSATPSRPDGACVDAEGCYWVAGNGGGEILRYSPSGVLDRRLRVPVSKPSMMAFGGKNLDVMFVTSVSAFVAEPQAEPLAGKLFALRPGVTGLPEPAFAG